MTAYGPYKTPPDDIEIKYNEPAPVGGSEGFRRNLTEQLDRAMACSSASSSTTPTRPRFIGPQNLYQSSH
jgi:hypothetical protein